MNRLTPWTIFIRACLLCALTGVVLFGLSVKKVEHLPLSGTPLRFDEKSAHQYMTRLSKGFPRRYTWSDERRRATVWLKEEFKKLGYTPRGMLFSETIDGRQYTDLENVYAEKRGTTHPEEILVVVGHYDITDTTVEGAMDDASGVAVVLELARVLAKEETKRTVIFLATDSEEFGAFWGARAFARDFERSGQIVAALNFDFVAPEKQVAILTLCDGLKAGYTPLWLRELALDSVRSIGGVRAEDMTGVVEHIQRAIQIPAADHGAFLAAGIPSFNWVGQNENFAREMAHYHHTNFDVAEALQPESFASYGKSAERLLRSLDALGKIPEDFRSSSYWKVSEELFVEGWVATLLHILAFIPFLAYGVSKFGLTFRRSSRRTTMLVLRNEAKNMGIVLGSFLSGYLVMQLLPALRIITRYEAFPATQKSRILYNPDFLAMLLVILVSAAVYFTFRKVFFEPDDDKRTTEYAEIRHAFHAGLLTLIIFLAFLKNSYLGTLLLLPPAYLWTLLRSQSLEKNRLFNSVLLLGGTLTFIAVVVVVNTVFHVGVAYWYLFLSAVYGLFSAYSVLLFFMALTVMIRLFRAFVL